MSQHVSHPTCFFLSSVFCSGFAKEIVLLEADIKKTKEDVVAVTKDNDELIIIKMVEEAASCKGKINVTT